MFEWGERRRILTELLRTTRAAQRDADARAGEEQRVPPLTAAIRMIAQIADERSVLPTYDWSQQIL